MSKPVLLDVTSLVAEPFRSGIQRVEREVMRHWPEPDQLIPVSLDPSGRILQLPDSIREILSPAGEQPPSTFEQDQQALGRLLAGARLLPDGLSRHLLNLELFFERWRTEAYLRMCRDGWRVQWLVYDFLPWLHPELFPQGSARSCMQYLRALRAVPEVAFISQQTRSEYEERVMRGRRRPGPVMPLGADGLGLERQSWSPARRDVVLIGTIEKRKNIDLVMDAFRLLWAGGLDIRLILAGRIAPPERALLDAFASEAGPQRLWVLDHATDPELRAVLRGVRVLLYASTVEGFGLPPYEAIDAGIPAIAAATLPSIQLLPPYGHIRLSVVTRETLAEAVLTMMDDDKAARLWAETAKIKLPSWRVFSHAVADWANSQAAVRPV